MNYVETNPDAHLLSLVEGWGDLIDPLQILGDEQAYGFGVLASTRDRAEARRQGDNWPHWSDEHALASIRGRGCYIGETDPTAINVLQTLASYVIGEGLTATATAKPDSEAEDAAWHASAVIDEFLERSRWNGSLDAELFIRKRKAGERLVHIVDEGSGYASVEVVEPSWLTEPYNGDAIADFGGSQELVGLDWKYGIASTPGRPGDVKAYFVQRYGDADDYEVVPASRMSHAKANVESGVKRGLTDFYGGAEEWIGDSRKALRNIIRGAALQAAIAYFRKHNPRASEAAIQSAAQEHIEYFRRTPTGDGGSKSEPVERFGPGTIVDAKGYDAMYGPMGTPVGPQLIGPVEAALRYAGRRWGFPEDMMSGNASGTNFASILEAHTPFTIARKREQIAEARSLEDVLWIVLDIACEARRIPYGIEELRAAIDLVATPADIETRDQMLDL